MLTHNEPMAKHCSFRVGGIAQDFFTPNTLNELSDFLKSNQKPILMLGLGSNLLVRDRGFLGVAIKLTQLNQLGVENGIVQADAGVTLAKLSRFCGSQGLNGAEFLSAIPGSVGGALAMNAGAFGFEIWSSVESVTTINTLGKVFKRSVTEFDIAYRKVAPQHKDEYFISASLRFSQTNKQQNIKALLKKRNDSQPIGEANCGSVFKNPPNNFAAKLIEDSNLKGFCIGGACVSSKHANFITNQDNATADDIENLIKHIQQTVKSMYDISLETEVVII
ncbi:UDP-N-acetylmuramate dehydrogenase [thiotrophic endosymbiont of Bathymodiolus puteoserpentis (Logatchev)]|jgi:UDP-N-acetylmuramate dehydrogenase|uniref:UDP-N-acetylmuramate dehydrogenase n=1 Tax=thiotrophic endosymbiont of Bathymodiolus puteoserpentis (Logatchev) TaxID=343240 RepID=UPI0010B6A221|nr:UDP-N-acetylmuramate dehydrogenase [thiotrophic endosymbiont of Bathymodiolus puteoserpentis (Logatchev)]SSC10124.1 UDP-N-acetylenolpyruvoylglucosamine reductase [thiotrophic endosymbiont of Bathymodiolus puteoserpentis (Logatchev)]